MGQKLSMLSFPLLLIYCYLVNSAEIAFNVGVGASHWSNQEIRSLGAAVSYYWGLFGISALGSLSGLT